MALAETYSVIDWQYNWVKPDQYLIPLNISNGCFIWMPSKLFKADNYTEKEEDL